MTEAERAHGLDLVGMQARIANARKARRMSLESVAQAAGMSKSHIWELEQGRSANPTVKAVWAVSGALSVSPAWLLGLDPNTPPIDPLALEIAALINQRLAVRAMISASMDRDFELRTILEKPDGTD